MPEFGIGIGSSWFLVGPYDLRLLIHIRTAVERKKDYLFASEQLLRDKSLKKL